MTLNVSKLLNDILEGVVFYTYEHVRAIYLLARFPFRGPRVLAYWSVKNRDRAVGPHAFLLINLMIVFIFLGFASPLLFVFHNLKIMGPELSAEFERLRSSEFDFLPPIFRSLVIMV